MAGEQTHELGEHKTSLEWVALTNEVQALCVDLNERTSDWTGLSNDPAAFSLILFKRAYGHIRSFSLLYNDKFYLDADGCARNAVEVAICLANLAIRREAFVDDLRSDAAFTTKGQIPIWYDADPKLAREATADVTKIFGERRSGGAKHEKLSMLTLAKNAGLTHLYNWHRHYSGIRVHVTGLSILSSIVAVGDGEHEQLVGAFSRSSQVFALATICGASAISCEAHANLHRVNDLRERAAELMRRMSQIGPAEVFGLGGEDD